MLLKVPFLEQPLIHYSLTFARTHLVLQTCVHNKQNQQQLFAIFDLCLPWCTNETSASSPSYTSLLTNSRKYISARLFCLSLVALGCFHTFKLPWQHHKGIHIGIYLAIILARQTVIFLKKKSQGRFHRNVEKNYSKGV